MPEAVSFLQIKIIQVSLFLPKPMAKSLNHTICQLDMVLCKEKLENKEPRQKQVLEYEGSSGTEGLKEAWNCTSFWWPQEQSLHSSSPIALPQGFWLLREDSTSALKSRGGIPMCISLSCVQKSTAGQEICSPFISFSFPKES